MLRATNIDLNTGKLIFDELKYLREDLGIKSKYSLKKDSLLICFSSGSKSHLGKIALVDDYYSNFYFGGFIGQITPSDKIDYRYLFYCLSCESYKDYILKLTDGVNINNLKATDLKAFQIPLPPLSEQKRIVAILYEAFAAIDKAKANAEKNLANAKELFESYLNGIFANPGEDWEEKKLGDVCEIINGGTPKSTIKKYWNGDVNWVTPKDLGQLNNRYIENTPRRITKLGLQKSSAKLFLPRSVILSWRSPRHVTFTRIDKGFLKVQKKTMKTNKNRKYSMLTYITQTGQRITAPSLTFLR